MGGLARPACPGRLSARVRWVRSLAEVAPGPLSPIAWIVRLGSPGENVEIGIDAAALADAAALGPKRGAERLARRRLLSALSGRLFGIAPEDVGIVRDADGALRLTVPEPAFVSHAGRGGWAVVALSPHPIGVDVEESRPAPPWPFDLLHAAEQARLSALPEADRAAAFARLWVVKEAYAKAARIPLETVLSLNEVIDREGMLSIRDGCTTAISVHELTLDEVVAAAVVLP